MIDIIILKKLSKYGNLLQNSLQAKITKFLLVCAISLQRKSSHLISVNSCWENSAKMSEVICFSLHHWYKTKVKKGKQKFSKKYHWFCDSESKKFEDTVPYYLNVSSAINICTSSLSSLCKPSVILLRKVLQVREKDSQE